MVNQLEREQTNGYTVHIHTQENYSNPRACVARVNQFLLSYVVRYSAGPYYYKQMKNPVDSKRSI